MKFKVVINVCYGGFDLSEEAFKLLSERTGLTIDQLNDQYIYMGTRKDGARSCPDLIAVIEELGVEAASCEDYSQLKIVELKDVDGRYRISDYDGDETVHTPSTLAWESSLNSCNEGN